MSYCKTIILGRLTRDIELRFSAKGTAVAKIGVAINREWTQDGEKKSECTFLDITAFSKQAETLTKFLKKGSMLFCEARPRMDEWDDSQSGQKRSKLVFVLESFQFVGGDREQSGEAPTPQSPRPPAQRAPVSAPATATNTAPPDAEDDVPFTCIPPTRIQSEIIGFRGNKLL